MVAAADEDRKRSERRYLVGKKIIPLDAVIFLGG